MVTVERKHVNKWGKSLLRRERESTREHERAQESASLLGGLHYLPLGKDQVLLQTNQSTFQAFMGF